MNNKSIILFLMSSTAFLIFFAILISEANIINNNIYIIITFFLIIIFSLLQLFGIDKAAYSLNKIFWTFNLIFFGIVPMSQYLLNIRPWSTLVKLDIDFLYFTTNIILIIWFISYIIGFKYQEKRKVKSIKLDSYKLTSGGYTIALGIGIISSIILGEIMDSAIDEDTAKSSRLLLFSFLRALAIFSYVSLVIYTFQENKRSLFLYNILLLFLILMYVIPLGGDRYFFATMFIGLFLLHKRRIKGKHSFSLALILGVLVAFPLLGFLRYFHSIDEIISNYKVVFEKTAEDAYFGGNFDAYTMILNTIQYTFDFGYAYGYQFLGAFFFFIPRSIWIDKPIGSGANIAESYNYFFSNLSEPLIAESYLNFGLIGIIFIGFYIGRIISYFDKTYWNNMNNNIINYNILIYPFALGFFFFVQRGDFLSSYSFLFGFMITTFFYYKTFKKFFSKKNIKGNNEKNI